MTNVRIIVSNSTVGSCDVQIESDLDVEDTYERLSEQLNQAVRRVRFAFGISERANEEGESCGCLCMVEES